MLTQEQTEKVKKMMEQKNKLLKIDYFKRLNKIARTLFFKGYPAKGKRISVDKKDVEILIINKEEVQIFLPIGWCCAERFTEAEIKDLKIGLK